MSYILLMVNTDPDVSLETFTYLFIPGSVSLIIGLSVLNTNIIHLCLIIVIILSTFIIFSPPKWIFISMTPITLEQEISPSKPIVLTGRINNSLGEPVEGVSIGGAILCIRSPTEDGCRMTEIVCEIDSYCGMCECVRTNRNGEYKFHLLAPEGRGEYLLKVVAIDDMGTMMRVSDSERIIVN